MEEHSAEPRSQLTGWAWAAARLEDLASLDQAERGLIREAIVARLAWLEQESLMEQLTRRPGVRWSVDVECVNNLDHVRERQVVYLQSKLTELDALA